MLLIEIEPKSKEQTKSLYFQPSSIELILYNFVFYRHGRGRGQRKLNKLSRKPEYASLLNVTKVR